MNASGTQAGARTGRLMMAAWLATVVVASSQTANEQDLWGLWERHEAQPESHDTHIAACRDFTAKNPTDPLQPVVRGIEAWHLLKLARIEEAVELFAGQLRPPRRTLDRGAEELARAWLSRLDRERVKATLQSYYRKEVRYPDRIEDVLTHPKIPKSAHPVMQDRWGDPWRYELVGFKTVPGMKEQKYLIESVRLGSMSDFTTALELPYAERIRVKPVRFVAAGHGRQVIEFEEEWGGGGSALVKKKVVMGPGDRLGLVTLLYVGQHLMVVYDRLHWRVFLNPR